MASSGGIDTYQMLLIHRLLRRELGKLPALIRGAAGDRARAKRVAAHVTEMLSYLHTHHSGEDELLWPVLRPRVTLEAELIDRMEAQHAQLAAAIEQARLAVPAWGDSADHAEGERIASVLESAEGVLIAHLAEEEERILPLVSAHFSQDEWNALGKHGLAATPPSRRLVMLGYILHETTDVERAQFLAEVPLPARVGYKLIGRRQYAREAAEFLR